SKAGSGDHPCERDEQLDGVVDVHGGQELRRRVDVARRDRDEPRRDPGAAEVVRVGIRMCASTYDLDRAGDLLLLGRLVEQVEYRRAERRAAREHRTPGDRVVPGLLEL